jgi:hypothetical protein
MELPKREKLRILSDEPKEMKFSTASEEPNLVSP